MCIKSHLKYRSNILLAISFSYRELAFISDGIGQGESRGWVIDRRRLDNNRWRDKDVRRERNLKFHFSTPPNIVLCCTTLSISTVIRSTTTRNSIASTPRHNRVFAWQRDEKVIYNLCMKRMKEIEIFLSSWFSVLVNSITSHRCPKKINTYFNCVWKRRNCLNLPLCRVEWVIKRHLSALNRVELAARILLSIIRACIAITQLPILSENEFSIYFSY